MTRPTFPKILLTVSIAVWVALIVAAGVNALWVPSFEEVGHLAKGCYRTDALWFYVECRGFALSAVVSKLLTLPYLVWLGPGLLLLNPLAAVPLWFLLLFPVWYVWFRRKHT